MPDEDQGYYISAVILPDGATLQRTDKVVAEVLQAMEHDPTLLLERLRLASETAIQRGDLKISDARRLMDHLETSLRQTTYLQG